MPSINWLTKVIYVPQSYLTNLGGGIYELNVDEFRLDLKDIEDSEEGMTFPRTHVHNTQVTLSGVTYARTVEIINGYTIEFQNGNYTVKCVGANHNVGDVKVVNSVSLLIGNSAGLITVTSGSGVTSQDKADIAALVWEELQADHETAGSLALAITELLKHTKNRWKIENNRLTVYDDDGVSVLHRFDLKDEAGAPTNDAPYERIPV